MVRRGIAWGEALAVLVLAAVVRAIGIGREPAGDELYHILSAREYLSDGRMGINGGLYDRVALWTEMVAGSYRLFGESVVAARLPALLCGALTVALVFLWLRTAGARAAAWIAAALLAVDPLLVELSQLSRFYTIQHVLFVLAALAAYAAAEPGRPIRTRLGLAAGTLAILAAAGYFQAVTLVGAGGILLFLALASAPEVLERLPRRMRIPAVGVALLAGALVAALLLRSNIGARLLDMAEYSDLWASQDRTNVRYYHWMFQNTYPILWGLFPLLAVVALATRPRVALLAISIFGVSFVAHTLMAWKTPRYLAYALPFFFTLCALAIATLAPIFGRLLRAATDQLAPLRERPGASRAVRGLAVAGIVGFVLLANPAFLETLRRSLRDQSFLYPGGTTPTLSWALVEPALEPIADSVATVVSTEDLEAIYFLDRLDFVLDKDHLHQGSEKPEFTMDRRINAQMVSRPESMARIIECSPSGLLVAMRWALDTDYKVPAPTAALIRERLRPVPLPSESGLVAFRWETPAEGGLPACPSPPSGGTP
jgi:4-amino-4-deoxy-L-arabinose transferase-like glycosyltransferase